MQNEVSQIINRSILLKFISAIVSLIKIVISSVFLSKFNESCDNSDITNWLILMMIHDFLNVFYVAFYMIFSRFFANRRSLLAEYENQIRAQYQPLGEDGANVQVNQNNDQHQDLVESQCKFLLVIKELNKMYFLWIIKIFSHLSLDFILPSFYGHIWFIIFKLTIVEMVRIFLLNILIK